MAKPKGSPKTGGRKKGTPNKIQSVAQIRHALPALGFDLAQELIDLYRHADTDVQTKAKLIQLLFQYTQVQPTTDDIKNDQPPEQDQQALTAVPTSELLKFTKKAP